MQDLIFKHLWFCPPSFPLESVTPKKLNPSAEQASHPACCPPFRQHQSLPCSPGTYPPLHTLASSRGCWHHFRKGPKGQNPLSGGGRHRTQLCRDAGRAAGEWDGATRTLLCPRPPPPAPTPDATPRCRARSRRGRARPRRAPLGGGPGHPPRHSPAAHVRGRAGRAERRERYCRGPAPGACAIQTPPRCTPGRARCTTPRRTRRAASRRPLPAAASRPAPPRHAPPASPRARAASEAELRSREGAWECPVIAGARLQRPRCVRLPAAGDEPWV